MHTRTLVQGHIRNLDSHALAEETAAGEEGGRRRTPRGTRARMAAARARSRGSGARRPARAACTWGDNPHSAEGWPRGPRSGGTVPEGFSVRFSESGEVSGVQKGVPRGPVGPPKTPWAGSPVLEEGGSSLVDCMVVVWWLYGGCMVVLKVSPGGYCFSASAWLTAAATQKLKATAPPANAPSTCEQPGPLSQGKVPYYILSLMQLAIQPSA